MTTNINSVGKGIRQLRLLHNLSQKYMAEKLGMTQGNFARIENGYINVSMERLEIMAAMFGCTTKAITDFQVNESAAIAEAPGEVISFQISRELKELYEGYIQSLEDAIKEFKAQAGLNTQDIRSTENNHEPE